MEKLAKRSGFFLLLMLFVLLLTGSVDAQRRQVTRRPVAKKATPVKSDTIDKYIKDMKIGMQVAYDYSFFTFPPGASYNQGARSDSSTGDDLVTREGEMDGIGATEYLAKQIGFDDYHWLRADLFFGGYVSSKTRIATLLSYRAFNRESGLPEDNGLTIMTCALEHRLFNDYRLRMGRMGNRYSESRFFGRIALGEKDAHVFGRTPFINDAIEFASDTGFKKKHSVDFAVGWKWDYTPLGMEAAYGTGKYTKEFKRGTKLSLLGMYALHKQQWEDVSKIDPSVQEDQLYHAVESEVALDFSGKVIFYVNTGGYIDYRGIAPHYASMRDITKGNEPRVLEESESWKETMIAAGGVTFNPSKISNNLSFFRELTAEFELCGVMNDAVKAYNSYFHARFLYETIFIDYGLYLNFLRYAEDYSFKNADGKVVLSVSELYNICHFIRVSTSLNLISNM